MFKSSNRIAVYTAIYGGYDDLQNPKHVRSDVDYICFTDAPIESDVYRICIEPGFPNNPTLSARRVKICSYRFLPQYERTLWLDANMRLLADPVGLLDEWLANGHNLGVFTHPHRRCLYAEGKACIEMHKVDPARARRQLAHYKQRGYPENNGLVSTGIIARRRSAELDRFESQWWKQVKRWTARDQLSFNFAGWLQEFDYNEIPGDIFCAFDLIEYNAHGRA